MIDLIANPFIERLEKARRVLIAGAGGGFDVYCGLPLFFALRDAGKEVHLANLSFTRFEHATPGEAVQVTGDSEGPEEYFPEKWLSQWLCLESIEQPVYAFPRTGVRPLTEAYQKLCEKLQLDAIVLVDGGTDSLMRGDEIGLGTPEEDLASLAAVHEQEVIEKLLMCVGFGIDAFHGVCHAHFLESVADLAASGDHLGTFALLRECPHVSRYLEAVEYACEQNVTVASIVNTSIISAIEGKFGDHHHSRRTIGSTLWINPLMSLCWCFDLAAVVNRSLVIPQLKNTETYRDVSSAIEEARERFDEIKPRQAIPV